MIVKGFTDQGATSQDNLFAGEFPRVSILTTITGGNYSRGTVLGKITSNGKYKISAPTPTNGTADGSETPCAILAEAVNTTSEDKQAVIYLTGEFNSAALSVGTGYDVDDVIDDLRAKSIFIKTNQSY